MFDIKVVLMSGMIAVVQTLDLSLPDLVGIAYSPIAWSEGKKHPHLLIKEPVHWFPTSEQIDGMSGEERGERARYFLTGFTLIFCVIVLLGSGIFVLGPLIRRLIYRSRYNPGRYATLDEQNPMSQSAQKSLVSISFASAAVISACVCWYSSQTGRVNKVYGLDWEMYMILFSAGMCG
eukprot:Skav216824  [mRNA]  locus=scaffold135:217528:218061:- [translate_table: standard]